MHHDPGAPMDYRMTQDTLPRWLDTLGYASAGASLHYAGQRVHEGHPYAVEIDALLSPEGDIQARAVFDVEGVPTVCFLADDGDLLSQKLRLQAIRRRIWNQNLISIVVVVQQNRAHPMPVRECSDRAAPLALSDATASSPFSAADVQSGDVRERFPTWFKPENRVDHHLLRNLGEAVRALEAEGLDATTAQVLLGQVLFVSYLEHRCIVSDAYRSSRRVRTLGALMHERSRTGIQRLLSRLRQDFNGDFLKPDDEQPLSWSSVGEGVFEVLDRFLSHVDLSSGQTAIWTYDFSYIPVELISGIYETFLASNQRRAGAFYTPRHLANLVVDQAFEASADPLSETIYDGACGSGILLTTAFRRLLHVAERRQGRPLSLTERIDLLTSRIFGSDISVAACRVSAFSLYLSLLERLSPADIARLQDDEQVKLPPLLKSNLRGGSQGDFFAKTNPFASSQRFTMFLCNPPWVEPGKDDALVSDRWAEAEGLPRSRRQLAGDFAQHAVDSLADHGRMCLILPASLLLAATSADFIKSWLLRVQLTRVINFSDQRELIFKSASHACVVVLATPRRGALKDRIAIQEDFEYWCPKADVSLLFGRLTLNSGDRHTVQTQSIWSNHRRLVTLMWGNEFDLALWSRLRLAGTFADMFSGKQPRWRKRKGFHHQDRHAPEVSSRPLHQYGFLPAEALHGRSPVLDGTAVRPFPKSKIPTVAARLSPALTNAFHGPRILFPDGPSPDLEIRAVFTQAACSFKNSVGVLMGPDEDEELLRFAAVYLRSDLVSYFLLTQAYQVLSERHRVALRDVGGFPFMPPERHPDPALARRTVAKVADITRRIESSPALLQEDVYLRHRPTLQKLVYRYFGLTELESDIVREAVHDLLPSVQPRGFRSVYTPLQYHAETARLERYALRLQAELESWRDHLGGRGNFDVAIMAQPAGQVGPLGIVRVTLRPHGAKPGQITLEEGDRVVHATLARLRQDQLLPMAVSANLYFAADTVIRAGHAIYLVKPRVRRLWLERIALRDAERIVDTVDRMETDGQEAA